MKPTAKVFVVNCDWRDIFRTAPIEFEDKIRRDHLGIGGNSFFYLSFARVSYRMSVKNFSTWHLKTKLDIFRPLLDFMALFSVSWAVFKLKLRPDVWLTYDFGFLPALCLARLFFGGKIVMVLTNQPRVYSRTRKFGKVKSGYSFLVERFFWWVPDSFLTINETMKKYLRYLGVPDNKIFIFYTDTISRDQNFLVKSSIGKIKKRLGLNSTAKIILTIARLEPEKNLLKLLELFSSLDDKFILIILGQGNLLMSLQEKVRELKIENRVFFEGWIDRENIWNYYRDANVFVLLSKAEALGIVFWEAMYLGLPVLGSRVSGIIETIGRDGERGRLWEELGGAEDFKSKIFFCVSESREKEEMIKRARMYVAEKINNPIVLNDLL
jgi:glycosyltransferase involved in cell wall biosynthesis